MPLMCLFPIREQITLNLDEKQNWDLVAAVSTKNWQELNRVIKDVMIQI